MTDASVSGGPLAAPRQRAQTLAVQGLVNRIVRGLLRTPLACRVLGNRLVTLYVVGRKSGRHYTVPVAYTRDEGTLLVGTPFATGRSPWPRRSAARCGSPSATSARSPSRSRTSCG